MANYPDAYRNALATSHGMSLRTELSYGTDVIGALRVSSGTVSADRGGSVRRTVTLGIDPSHLNDSVIAARLNPYGSSVRIWRGVRYPNGTVDEWPIFTGRIDSVDLSIDELQLNCSDLAATIVDSEFANGFTVSNATTNVVDLIQTLITDVMGGVVFHNDLPAGDPGLTAQVRDTSTWETGRADALNDLAGQIGAEWFADMAGEFHLRKLPAVITATTPVVWTIDSGDTGVTVTQSTSHDRQGVYNEVYVIGEPIGGDHPAVGHWTDTDPNSSTVWGGPFGKIPRTFTSQLLNPNTTIGATERARVLGLQSISRTRSLSVTCIPNPALLLGDVVSVWAPALGVSDLFYIQALTMPCTQDEAMSLTLNQTLETTSAGYRRPDPRGPEGMAWPPGM